MEMEKPLHSILEDTLTYQGHDEVCGCLSDEHDEVWPLTVTLRTRDVRLIQRCLHSLQREEVKTVEKKKKNTFELRQVRFDDDGSAESYPLGKPYVDAHAWGVYELVARGRALEWTWRADFGEKEQAERYVQALNGGAIR